MSGRAVTEERERAGARASVRGSWTGVFASVGVHALAIAALGAVHAPSVVTPMLPVEVEMVDAPPPPEREAPPPPAPVEPAVEPSAKVARTPPPREAEPAPTAQRPEPAATVSEPLPPAEPVELTGTTLTNEAGSWSTSAGDGRAMTGPIRGGRSTVARVSTPVASAVPAQRREVFVSSGLLSRRPRAPNLDAVLARNVPIAARSQGIGGDAVVTVKIAASGAVVAVTVVTESYPGFGAACRQTVIGSRWTPPLGEDGRAVGTEVRYRCQFQVDR